MIDVKFEIKGLEKLKEGLRRAPEKTISEISRAVEESALTVESHAKRESPVNKQSGGGNLRQNIRMRMISKTRAEVSSKAPYSGYVEYGTRPHVIRPRVKKGLANKRTGQFFGKIVHHPGTRANPFMKRALEISQIRIQALFKTAMMNVINTFK